MHGTHVGGQALAGELGTFAKIAVDPATSGAACWSQFTASLNAAQVKLNRGLDFPSLDDVLVDMKLTPDVLELPCPAYFREERAKVFLA